MPLHEKQKRILDRLAETSSQGISAPSILELVELLGVRSPAVVQYHLKRLEEGQYIRRTRRKSRGLSLTDSGRRETTYQRIPVLGDIAAGIPIYAHEDNEANDLVRRTTDRAHPPVPRRDTTDPGGPNGVRVVMYNGTCRHRRRPAGPELQYNG